MIVEDLYRVLCNTTPLTIREYFTNKTIYKGEPDSIPMPVMMMEIKEIKPQKSTGRLIIYV